MSIRSYATFLALSILGFTSLVYFETLSSSIAYDLCRNMNFVAQEDFCIFFCSPENHKSPIAMSYDLSISDHIKSTVLLNLLELYEL